MRMELVPKHIPDSNWNLDMSISLIWIPRYRWGCRDEWLWLVIARRRWAVPGLSTGTGRYYYSLPTASCLNMGQWLHVYAEILSVETDLLNQTGILFILKVQEQKENTRNSRIIVSKRRQEIYSVLWKRHSINLCRNVTFRGEIVRSEQIASKRKAEIFRVSTCPKLRRET